MKHELFEDNTHSFIVKVWLERTTKQTDQGTWRGHITHVPSGERRYLKDLNEIIVFIAPYLGQTGAKRSMRRWMRRCLERLRKCLSSTSSKRVKEVN